MLTSHGYRDINLSARDTARLVDRVAAIAPTDPLGTMTAWVLPPGHGPLPGFSPRGEISAPAPSPSLVHG